MFIELTKASYGGSDNYRAGKKVRVNTNNINYYQSYQSKGYGDGGNVISEIFFINDSSIYVMEQVDKLDKIFKTR